MAIDLCYLNDWSYVLINTYSESSRSNDAINGKQSLKQKKDEVEELVVCELEIQSNFMLPESMQIEYLLIDS